MIKRGDTFAAHSFSVVFREFFSKLFKLTTFLRRDFMFQEVSVVQEAWGAGVWAVQPQRWNIFPNNSKAEMGEFSSEPEAGFPRVCTSLWDVPSAGFITQRELGKTCN